MKLVIFKFSYFENWYNFFVKKNNSVKEVVSKLDLL